MGLREGKNREIKRVLESLGLSVNRLIRISFGPFELADLAEGEVAEARTRVLRDQLGPRLAREAGVDFDAPLVERAEPEPTPAPAAETRRPPRSAASRPPPSTLPRPGRAEPQSRDAPRREPPRSAGPERKRKHIDALRAESAAAAAGTRKRIERSATSDRKGRVVAVERVLPTREEERRRELARRKAEERREGRAPRAGKPYEPRNRAEGGERPPRRPDARFSEGRSAERSGRDATPREDRAPRPPRAGKPYEPRNRAEGGPRSGKAFQSRDRGEGGPRPPRRSGERLAAAPGAERSGGAPASREDRAPRKPRLNKPFAKRPPGGGKGHGGPRGARPGGPRPPRRP
jgi:23S rRNA pseudouridine2605 synthase